MVLMIIKEAMEFSKNKRSKIILGAVSFMYFAYLGDYGPNFNAMMRSPTYYVPAFVAVLLLLSYTLFGDEVFKKKK